MKRKTKKILVFALALSMVFPSVTAFATESVATPARLKIYGTDFQLGNGVVQSNYSKLINDGESVAVTATGDNFIGWMDVSNNKMMSRTTDCTVNISGATTYAAVYNSAKTGTAYVEYVNSANQVIQAETYSADSDIVEPDVPAKPGYTNGRWMVSTDEIKARIANGETAIKIEAEYDLVEAYYSVTMVYDSDVDSAVTESNLPNNSYYTAVAKDIEGKKFAYWSNAAENGDILSYEKNYSVKVSRNKVLYAIYVDESETVVAQPTIGLCRAFSDGNGTLTWETYPQLPDGYTLVQHGILRSHDSNYSTTDTLTYANKDNIRDCTTSTSLSYATFSVTVPESVRDNLTIYVRPYLIVKDSSGTQITVEANTIWAYTYSDWVALEASGELDVPVVPEKESTLGTQENPEVITEVDTTYTTTISDETYYYSYTATEAGTLSISTYTDGAAYAMTNKTVGGDAVTNNSVAINVGDVVKIAISGAEGTVEWYLMFTAVPGTENNPLWVSIPTTTTDAIAAGSSVYYHGYGLGTMILTVEDINAYVIYDGQTYSADENGVVTVQFAASMGRVPIVFQIGNAGTEAEAYTMNFAYPVGSSENPAEAVIGANTTNVEANSSGYFYTYTATADGTLTVTMNSDNWTYVINNMTTYAYGENHASDDETVVATETIEVAEGDEIQIVIGTPDWSEADVEWTLEFVEDAGLDTDEDTDEDLGDIF